MNKTLEERDVDKFDRCCVLFRAGATIREVCRTQNIAKQTAQGIRTAVLDVDAEDGLPPILCPCGRSAGHKGWCSFRLKHSPARQETLKKMHKMQKMYLT